MNAGRRIVLSAAFLGLAVALTSTTARAQDREPHKIWQSSLTPEQLKAALARMGGGGENRDPFRDQIMDLMKGMKDQRQLDPRDIAKAQELLQKHPELLKMAQQMAKERQMDPGRPGKLTPEDLGKLFQVKPGGPFQVPDPKNFVPPKIDPVQPGKVDPARPPMKVDRPPGKVDQPPMKVDPPPPPPPGGDKKKITIDENPFPPPENTDPRTKSLDALTAIWERNIGPLSETPEVQRALLGLIEEGGLDFDIKDERGNSLWDLLKTGDGSGFGDFFNGEFGGGGNWFSDWEWPRFNWGGGGGGGSSWNWPRWSSSSSSSPRPSSSGWGSGGGGFGFGAGAGAWIPFAILLFIILAVVVWFQLKNLQGRGATAAVAADGLGPWPVDPREINTREDVVKAFEYLSVLICGPSAKTWTHSTIADALSDLATTHAETAVMLARLYELARYAPLNEPLTRDEVIEARKLVCQLAGVSY
jgi:hypothetical protein